MYFSNILKCQKKFFLPPEASIDVQIPGTKKVLFKLVHVYSTNIAVAPENNRKSNNFLMFTELKKCNIGLSYNSENLPKSTLKTNVSVLPNYSQNNGHEKTFYKYNVPICQVCFLPPSPISLVTHLIKLQSVAFYFANLFFFLTVAYVFTKRE